MKLIGTKSCSLRRNSVTISLHTLNIYSGTTTCGFEWCMVYNKCMQIIRLDSQLEPAYNEGVFILRCKKQSFLVKVEKKKSFQITSHTANWNILNYNWREVHSTRTQISKMFLLLIIKKKKAVRNAIFMWGHSQLQQTLRTNLVKAVNFN